MKLVLMLVALFVIGEVPAAFAQIGPSKIVSIVFENRTAWCVWLTLYESEGPIVHPWHIIGNPESRPRFVKPHAGFSTRLNYINQLKVRTEIMQKGDCSGPVVGDTSLARTASQSGLDERPKAILSFTNSHFNLFWWNGSN